MASSAQAVQRFYTRWARHYDLLATHAPGVSRYREEMVDSLNLSRGDTVLDLGCGPGPTLELLRERVGPTGMVLGVDLTRELLARARARVERAGWQNVHLLQADVSALPLQSDFDGLCASFLAGMLTDPKATLEDWLDGLAPGGRLAVLTATPQRVVGSALDPLLRAYFSRVSPGPADPKTVQASPFETFRTRVTAAHETLRHQPDATSKAFLGGALTLSSCGVRVSDTP